MAELTIFCPGGAPGGRLGRVLDAALSGRGAKLRTRLPAAPGERILFAVALDGEGIQPALTALLGQLRSTPGALEGCIGGVVVDGCGELYTKAAARELVLAANLAGCAFVGRPLTEATGSLRNFTVQAANAACSPEEAYRRAVADLADRLLAFSPPRRSRPALAVLHASTHGTSNTLALWSGVRERLGDRCSVTEIGLRNGTLEDCSGCPYTMCLHFGERGGCFYGGVMVQEVYPAVRECDALVLLCPNYNDAMPANLAAAVNRLTALYRAVSFSDKALLGIVVSGYSGGDLVAAQLVGALCMNKGFWLPPRFCLLETANDAGEAARLPGIGARLDAFAENLCRALGPEDR